MNPVMYRLQDLGRFLLWISAFSPVKEEIPKQDCRVLKQGSVRAVLSTECGREEAPDRREHGVWIAVTKASVGLGEE